MTERERAIYELQQRLRNIAKNESDEPAIIPDGIFSAETRQAVERFQKSKGLNVTGVADYFTWEAIRETERSVLAEAALPIQVVPVKNSDLPLKKGMDNVFTDVLKNMLEAVAQKYGNFNFINEKGFDGQTEKEVVRWQQVAFLDETGEVDKLTWNSLAQHYLINE